MKVKFTLVALAIVIAGITSGYSQIIADPPEPTHLDAVVITLNTAGTGLENYTGDVYAHTGVSIVGVGAWQYVIGDWGNNSTQPMLTYISPGIYQLSITPSIRAFYNVPENFEIYGMNFVFRSETGTQQTADLFWQVYGTVIPDPVPVTFNVDMSLSGDFNPQTDDVYMSGSFASWNEPGTNPNFMMQPIPNNPNIYTLTVLLDPGYYEYKYFRVINNVPSWDNGEWPGGPNRSVIIEETTTINDVFGWLFPPLFGDSNCDGAVNVLDVVVTGNHIMGLNPEPFCFENADVNMDGNISILDIIETVNIIMGGS